MSEGPCMGKVDPKMHVSLVKGKLPMAGMRFPGHRDEIFWLMLCKMLV